MDRVFAIEYDKTNQLLHAISGPSKQRPLGFTFDAANDFVFGEFLTNWEPIDHVIDFFLILCVIAIMWISFLDI